MNSLIAWPTVSGWLATMIGSMPTGRFFFNSCMVSWMLRPSASTSPPSRMEIARPRPKLAVNSEDRIRRIGIVPPHLSDVGQADDAIAHSKIDGEDVFIGLERAADLQLDAFLLGDDFTGRDHDVLRLQCCRKYLRRQAVAGEFFRRKFDVDTLGLRPYEVHFRNIGHLQEPRTDILHIVAQLAICEPVRGEADR